MSLQGQLNKDTLHLSGEVDADGINILRGYFEAVGDDTVLTVDLTEVTFISYLGLGVFVDTLSRLRSHGGDLILSGVNVYTQRLLRMAGVDRMFKIMETANADR